MRDHAAHERSGELPLAAKIRDILAAPLHEAQILDPANGTAHQGVGATVTGRRLGTVCGHEPASLAMTFDIAIF
jgi:hypothetical protein